MDFKITQIYTYPIKSLGGIALQTAQLNSKGLEYDRFWMIVDETSGLVSQRDTPQMALFETHFTPTGVRVQYKHQSIELPFESTHSKTMNVRLWGSCVPAISEAHHINEWFSEQLQKTVVVVRPASPKNRFTKNHPDAAINFPDSSQFLVISQKSLDFLNKKLEKPIKINRFRPNIVFEGGTPHCEDQWTNIQIGTSAFESIKSCARCQMINLDQESATRSKEPLKTLHTYRSWENKIWFGRYFKYTSPSSTQISIGDTIRVL